jgi:hypothetical protein
MDHSAALAKALNIGALFHIRALNLIAEIDHDLGDARHADAANTHKMSWAEREWGWGRFHEISLSD